MYLVDDRRLFLYNRRYIPGPPTSRLYPGSTAAILTVFVYSANNLAKVRQDKIIIQLYQINMAVLFWWLVKSDARVRYCTVAYTGQVMLYKVPEQHGRVYLVTLYATANPVFSSPIGCIYENNLIGDEGNLFSQNETHI